MNRKQGIAVCVIVLCALILRLAFSAAVVGIDAEPRGDEIDYMTIAENITLGNGFQSVNQHPTARRPPLYPLFLAAWFRLFGPGIVLGRVVQCLLGAGIVLLLFSLGKKLFSVNTALLAAAVTACNPFLIFISAYVLTENLYIVLMLLLLLLLSGDFRERELTAGRAALCGVLLGLTSLCRPTAFLLWLFIAAVLLLFSRQRGMIRVRNTVLFLVMLAVTLLPWAWRNHARFGSWVLFTTHSGITFYQGNNQAVLDYPQYYGSVAPLYSLPGYDRLKTLDEVGKDQESWRLGKQFLRENKRRIPVLTLRKFQRFWRFRSEMGMSGIKSGWWWNTNTLAGKIASHFDAGLIYAAVIIPLFLAGLVLTARWYRCLILWYGVIIIHTLLALVFFGSLRSRLPLEPLIALLAAAGFMEIVRRLRRGRARAQSVSQQQGG